MLTSQGNGKARLHGHGGRIRRWLCHLTGHVYMYRIVRNRSEGNLRGERSC